MLKEREIYQFGEFTLDPTAKVVFKGGQPVKLTRKVVETLQVLVENHGQVLTKDEIMGAVWGGREVDEANLTQNIAVIRKALAVGQGDPAHIETFPGRGYRLEGPVQTVHANHGIEIKGLEIKPEEAPELTTVIQPPPPPPPEKTSIKMWLWALPFVAAGLAGAWLWSAPSSGEPHFRVAPITRMPGKEYQPAYSPDAQQVAFLWKQEGAASPELWLTRIGGASPQAVAKGTGHYSSPSWSPDGRSLAYLRIGEQATEIVIYDVALQTNRTVARITPPGYGFDYRLLDWSPDGASLVISHSEGSDDPMRLIRVSLPGGALSTPLTSPDAGVPGDVDPRFSPDGKSITFVRIAHRSSADLYMIPAKGGEARRITADSRVISSHDWLNAGSLVLGSNRTGHFQLWRMAMDTADPAKTMKTIGVFGEFPIQISASRINSSIVYSMLHEDRNIWRLDLEKKTWRRVIASTGQDASPQYSPDGNWISFRSDRSGEEQLWLSRADGSDPTPLTKGGMRPSVAHWAPNGRSLVFNNPLTGELLLAERGPKEWAVRSLGMRGIHPVFSPDGSWIYAGLGNDIIRIPAGGGTSTVAIPTKGLSLDISADGRFLYFIREQNDRSLWRAELATGELTKVLEGVVPGCTSCWAISKTGVYYLGTDRQSFDSQILYFRDFRTGKDTEILPYPEPLWPVGSGPFSLSPDGKSLLCVRVDPSDSDLQLLSPER